jgi:hypothetical protein
MQKSIYAGAMVFKIGKMVYGIGKINLKWVHI